MGENDHPGLRGDSGILLRVENGAVIGYDATGLILRLSDTVVDDLRARLGPLGAGGATDDWIDPAVLGDLDAWNVVQRGDWYHFDAKLPAYAHPRRFRRPVAGGHVVADTAGPLCAVLSIGGARRAWGVPGQADFPAHVVCPADDIGAVGVAGVEPARSTAGLEQAREITLDTMVADALLRRRLAEGRALPLILARCESDCSGSAGDLAGGAAIANLEQAIDNLVAAAAELGVAPRLLAVALDYGAEDAVSDFDSYISGMRAVMGRVAGKLAALGLHEPVFVMRSDETGLRLREHWHLAVFPGAHKMTFAAPGYAFAFDENHRPTPAAMAEMAQAEAAAIEAALTRDTWHCPRLLLAETQAVGEVRVTTDALGPLVLDAGLGCDAAFGFALNDGAVLIERVEIAAEDARTVILHHAPCDGPLTLHFADGRTGGLRDDTGRWALPARLLVGRC